MYEKKKISMAAGLICLLLCGCTRREQLVLEDGAAVLGQETPEPDMKQEDEAPEEGDTAGLSVGPDSGLHTIQPESAAAEEPQTICVHVCGAVNSPDVYELPAGSRVYEAVRAAGGFAEDADQSYVNQAQCLSDGVKLVIPTLEQTAEAAQTEESAAGGIAGAEPQYGVESAETASGAAAQGESADGRVNINTASEAELCDIPGIGATRAAAIVAYRQEKGGFASPEDIMNVSGIKEGTYEKIKDSIRVQ